MKHKTYKPVILLILDGFGIDPGTPGNAVKLAKMPNFEYLNRNYPATSIQASGISVGLFWGENGNSEVGHLNLGSGMVVYQNLPRISLSIQNKSFFKNEEFIEACNHVKENKSTLHLLGLVSAGGIHSHVDHLKALLKLAKDQKVKKVVIHAITDGRDTPRNAADKYISDLEAQLKKLHLGKIATVSGRFYTMDRDNRWDRIELAYKAIAEGEGPTAKKAKEAIAKSYKQKTFDESIVPTVITKNGQPVAKVEDNDSIIFFNFRADRAREITKAFVEPDFDKFPRSRKIENLYFLTMTQYEDDLPTKAAFPPQKIENPLAKVIAANNKKQMHVAETEKYAHVTYFFNGGNENPYPGEDQVVIPSPKVKTYEDVPEMSSNEVTEKIVKGIYSGKYDFIVANYANPDMIGHTGNLKATIKALECIDQKLKTITEAALSVNGAVIITADHGNCEQMVDPSSQEMVKEHSTNPVPFVLVTNDMKIPTKTPEQVFQESLNPSGVLADVAPTVLDLMNVKKPSSMTGMSLLPTLYKK